MKRFPALVLLHLLLTIIVASPLVAGAQQQPTAAIKQPQSPTEPAVKLDLGNNQPGVTSALPVQILVLLTLLSFIPAILISMTCFTRLIVVFHFLRQAMGSPEAPNNQVLLGLSLFITLFVMSPVLQRVNAEAFQPMLANQITQGEAISRALVPLRAHMLKNTRERDLALFIRLSGGARPQTADDVATAALIPAYMISELKTAFQIGFVLFIPFLVIDMAVASVLLSMGMMQLPPVIVSMPLKLLLFVMVDGWYLIIGSLVKSLL